MTGLDTEPKVVGIEQDSRETERERERDRSRVLLKMGDGVGNEFCSLEKIFMTDVRG